MHAVSRAGAVLTAVLLASGTAQAAHAAPAPGWRNVKTPKLAGSTVFGGIAAFSRKDAWAVGRVQGQLGSVFLHWNGKKWSAPAAAKPVGAQFGNPNTYEHTKVGGSSGSDVWVAGDTARKPGRPRAAHWNGKKWTVGELPASGTGLEVTAIKVISTKDAWVSGYTREGHPYLAHWNGRKWSPSATPALPADARPRALAATGPKDVWAVGTRGDNPLIAHWNGKKWSTVKTPNIVGGLEAIAILPHKKMWAVGNSHLTLRTTALRSDGGGTWRTVPSPATRLLNSVAGDGRGSVWMGMSTLPNDTDRTRTHYAHWNEKKRNWDVQQGSSYGPNSEPAACSLALIPGTHSLWSSGTGQGHPFIEAYGPLPG